MSSPTGQARLSPEFDLREPAISTCAYGFPLERAARIALREVAVDLAATPTIRKAIFALRGDDAYRGHREILLEIVDAAR